MSQSKYIYSVKTPYQSVYPLFTTLNIESSNTVIELGEEGTGGSHTYQFYEPEPSIQVTTPNGVINITQSSQGAGSGTVELNSSGTYIVRYSGSIVKQDMNGLPVGYEKYSFYYTISVVENKLPLKKWTITDVIKRTLELAEPLRKGEKPRFRLNKEQEEKFDKILSPELSFTRQTLRECLQEIGAVIHGEPRLKPVKDEDGNWVYEVKYDMFAGSDQSDVQYMPYASKGTQHAIEHYAGWLDSTAENLINQLDKYSGVIVEPYDDGAKSVRTENMYVRIQDDNMLIPTQYPIYTVDKLEYVYVKNGKIQELDITPYLFEKSEYDTRLSSYAEQYPYSKVYALWFSQGNKNIGGLNFKVPDASSLVEAYKNYAIVNIIRQASGDDSLLSGTNPAYPEMCFRVTYTPFYTARVSQTKSYYKDFMRPAALIFNQQSNVIESRYYGENLKGAIARLGNTEMSVTYYYERIYYIPEAGQKFNDDYYISAVATEILPTCIKCTVGLSKDFNRLSQYIGISSVKRYYEVSSGQAVERNTLYREYVVIGKQETPDKDCVTGDGMLALIGCTLSLPTINGKPFETGPITNVLAWGSSYSGNPANAVNLPVVTSAFGNSISFSWKYEDNYSAGAVAQYQNNDKVSGYFQNSYRYTDYYGRLYYYDFELQLKGPDITSGNLESISKSLPAGTEKTSSNEIISTIGKAPYILRKDNREALQVNFQIDFVTNLENIIIGSALASYCPAVRGTDPSFKPKLYVFPNALNKFTDHVEAFENVNLSELESVDVTLTVYDGYMVLSADRFPADGKSWAIVTSQTEKTTEVEGEDGEPSTQKEYFGGDLLLGQNIEIKSGQDFTPIYFTKKREIFDKSVWKDRK